jgi:hypothetical protein
VKKISYLHKKYLYMKIMKYGQVSFVVVRFIHWLSEIKHSERVRFENIPKSEKEPGFNQSEES